MCFSKRRKNPTQQHKYFWHSQNHLTMKSMNILLFKRQKKKQKKKNIIFHFLYMCDTSSNIINWSHLMIFPWRPSLKNWFKVPIFSERFFASIRKLKIQFDFLVSEYNLQNLYIYEYTYNFYVDAKKNDFVHVS